MVAGKVREPTLLEHFATSAIDTLAQAVIRESIQNSLDAVVMPDGDRKKPVRVRVYVSGTAGALKPSQAKRWFGDLFPHLLAQRKGLASLPATSDSCPFLVIEDFNTRGLQGAYDRNYPEDSDGENAWMYFFHKEGDTSKQESDRGRWGMGKVVFPGASRVHAFLAYTVRADGKRLMMGQAMLRSRTVNGQRYLPDAWYSHPATDTRPPMPLEDAPSIAEFATAFKLERDRQTGLSIVVPYVEQGGAERDDPGINFETVTDAVIAEYFLPILRGDLVVQVDSPERSTDLDRGSLSRLARSRKSRLVAQRLADIELAEWSVGKSGAPMRIGEHGLVGSTKWDDNLIDDETRELLRADFESGEPIAVRVPVQVRRKGQEDTPSYFDVFIRRTADAEPGRPTFVREGLIIPDVKCKSVIGVRSLVVIEDGGIATLLGDAENPAHTEWLSKSSNFKEKYLFGPSYIGFVTSSVEAIVRRIANEPDAEDPDMLLDIFSLSVGEEEEGRTRRRRRRRKGSEPADGPTPPPPKPRRVRVDKVAGGFSIRRGDPEAEPPRRLVVRAAYDIRRGDPFARWNPADFAIKSLLSSSENARCVSSERNRMVIDVLGAEFEITFDGFDERRDLRVDVRVLEVDDETND
jgi:hypothetical protein